MLPLIITDTVSKSSCNNNNNSNNNSTLCYHDVSTCACTCTLYTEDDLEKTEIDNESRFPAENSEVTFKLNIARRNGQKRERGLETKRKKE